MLRGLRSDRICDAAAQHPGCAQGSDFGALCQRALAGCKGVGEDVGRSQQHADCLAQPVSPSLLHRGVQSRGTKIHSSA